VLEVHPDKAALVSSLFNQAGVPCSIIGSVVPKQEVDIKVAGQTAIQGNTAALRLVGAGVRTGVGECSTVWTCRSGLACFP